MRREIRILVTAATLGIGVATSGVRADPVAPDPIHAPAVVSPLAAHSLLTAVVEVGSRLVAVGERGHVLLSDDLGVSWRQASVPTSVTLTAVRFADRRRGWATGHGGVVLRTDDGGETWALQLDGRKAAELMAAAVPEGDAAGREEALLFIADGPDKPFFDLLVRDDRHVLVVGAYGLAFETADGGETWRSAMARLPNPDRKHLYAILAGGGDDRAAVYVAGEQGLLLRSDDGGRAFTPLDTPYVGSFFGMAFGPDGGVLAFGLRGNLYRSGDRGGEWTRIPVDGERSLFASVRLRDGRLLLLDEGGGVWLDGEGERPPTLLPRRFGFPALGAVEPVPGELLVVGARGVARMTLDPSS